MIGISSDSTCDLSPELIAKYGIHIISLSIVMGDKVFKDGQDITPAELFRYVDEHGEICQTAAVNLYEYVEHFQRLREKYDSVVHISLGSGFSSSHQNAKLAALEVPGVYVVDSHNLSTGTGLLVLQAAELVQQGLPAEEVARILQEDAAKVEASFVLDRLDYMARGGRCSAVTAQGARLLKLRPSIEVVDGKMVVGRKFRGKLEKCLLDYVEARLAGRTDLDLTRIFVTHSGCSEEIVEAVKEKVLELAPFEEVLITTAGCTISNHCGPNTLGILFNSA